MLRRRLEFALFFALVSCAHPPVRTVELTLPTPPLYRAAGKGDIEVLRLANDHQIKGVNENGTSLLMVAARRNQLSSVDYLLSRAAPADAIDIHRQTVLHYALPAKNNALNSALLNAGADPSVEDQFGVVPAVVWAEQGLFESLLLSLQTKERWCCFAELKTELREILTARSQKKKFVPPAVFLVLKELE